MLAKNICLALLGFSAGITAAGGLFSFIIGLGVISDFADRTHTGEQVMLYEDAVAAGGSLGAVISVYHPAVPFAGCLLPVMGLFGGIFVGCWAMALAEMLDITQTHLSNIANGRVPGSLKLLLKLRSIFGCRLEDLVDPECDEAPVKANDKRMRRIKVIRYYENA